MLRLRAVDCGGGSWLLCSFWCRSSARIRLMSCRDLGGALLLKVGLLCQIAVCRKSGYHSWKSRSCGVSEEIGCGLSKYVCLPF